jgi:uncharacterized membrane protein
MAPQATPSQPDPLDRPAERQVIEALYGRGLLSAKARDEAVAMLRPPYAWVRFAGVLLLWLGLALILAGVICFFAFNWARMGDALKLALPQVALAACVVGAWRLGLKRTAGQALASVASVMVGVCLAVYGQVYQTGADEYELFLAWTLLILPWAALTRFEPLWLLWLALANTSLVLYADQATELRPEWTMVLMGGLNGAALVVKEFLRREGLEEFQGRWPRWLILPVALGAPLAASLEAILDLDWRAEGVAGLLLYGFLAALAWWHYRSVSPDRGCLGEVMLSLCLLVSVVAGRWIFEGMSGHFPLALIFLLLGVIFLGIFALGAWGLRGTYRDMAARQSAGGEGTHG